MSVDYITLLCQYVHPDFDNYTTIGSENNLIFRKYTLKCLGLKEYHVCNLCSSVS